MRKDELKRRLEGLHRDGVGADDVATKVIILLKILVLLREWEGKECDNNPVSGNEVPK